MDVRTNYKYLFSFSGVPPVIATVEGAIAITESVEQHFIVREAIAYDAISKDEAYYHVFGAMQ